jgi:phosphoglycerate kinase
MKIKFIGDIKNISCKKIILRADFNVPVENGKVVDIFKIERSLDTIKYIIQKGAKVILVSHIGRPEGVDEELSLRPVARELERLLAEEVKFKTLEQCEKQNNDKISLLENIRFYEGEEKNDSVFAERLAKLADIFVLDGFAVSHRASASVVGVSKFLPTYAGFLMKQEVESLNKILSSPGKPLVAILGGAKAETKIPILKNLLKISDFVLVGGAIANSYLFAKGYKIGDSVRDEKNTKDILRYCGNKKVVLPVDFVVGQKNGRDARIFMVDKNFSVDTGESIYDIGPETRKLFLSYINKARTIIWNGALGYFEQKPYEQGTFFVAESIAKMQKKAFSVCGGGETVEILQKLNLFGKINLVSTGGGAMLEFLSGKTLPGVKIITK